MIGIYVNENGCVPYAQAIVLGLKSIETRNRNMLGSLVGERVAIVRTRRGKNPAVVGSHGLKHMKRIGWGMMSPE